MAKTKGVVQDQKPTEIEIEPDAWDRFKSMVRRMAKPKAKPAKPTGAKAAKKGTRSNERTG